MTIDTSLNSEFLTPNTESAKLDPAMIAKTAADPNMAEAMTWLQCQAFDGLAAIIEKVAESLPIAPQQVNTKSKDFKQMSIASRHNAFAAKERYELAEAIVIGALLNRDNPDWNPMDPSTHRMDNQNALTQLLLNRNTQASS